MFIIPFIHNKKTIQGIDVSVIQILTIGGTTLWKEDDGLDINQDILESNGLYLSGSSYKRNNDIFCPIDPVKTTLSDFYRWEEIAKDDEETFCWRTFYLFSEMQSTNHVLPIPSNSKLHNRPLYEVLTPIVTPCGV